MAKKANKELNIDTDSTIQNSLLKKFSDVLISSDAIINSTKHSVIPISPSLNIGLSGGICSGTSSVFAGPPKVGKTTAALTLCKNAQKQGRRCFFISVESRLSKRDLQGIKDLDLSDEMFNIVTNTDKKILEGEQFLEITYELVKTFPGCVIVIDSISALASSSELTEDIAKQSYGGLAKTIKKFTKIISGIISVNDVTIVYISHTYQNMATGSAVISGGLGQRFFSDCIIKAKYASPIKASEKIIGQNIVWAIDNSPIGSSKFVTPPESILRFGVGLCRHTEILLLAGDAGIIAKGGGGWYTMPDGSKHQGTEAAYQYLIGQPKLTNELEYEVYKTYNPEVLNHYNPLDSTEEIQEEDQNVEVPA